MEFDDVTHSDAEPMTLAAASSRRRLLPWLLVFLSSAVAVASSVYFWRVSVTESERAAQAYVEKTRAEARLAQVEQLAEGQKQRLDLLLSEAAAASAKRSELESQVRSLESRLTAARAPKPAKGVKSTKASKKKSTRRTH